MKKYHQGVSLIELLIYSALLATILLVTYELFIQTSMARLSSTNNSAIFLGARRIFFDLGYTIRNSQAISSPLLTFNGTSLNLNGGNIIYSLDTNGSLIKQEGSEINKLTSNDVIVENLLFENLGPSTKQPTIKVSFTLKASAQEQGKERKETFQTAISLR